MVRKGSPVQVRLGAPSGRRSSVGQSSGIIIRESGVRVPAPLPLVSWGVGRGGFILGLYMGCGSIAIRLLRRKCANMRVQVTLACEECKRRNYRTMKNKKNNPDRIEFKKYCRWCGTHTSHKETK